MTSEPRRFLAVWIPDVERRAKHVAAGVVDEVTSQVLVAEEDFDVAREGENARVGGDNSVTGLTAATGLTLNAILGERDGNGDAVLGRARTWRGSEG